MNLVYGILTITLAAAGYFFSWKYRQKSHYQFAVLLLILSGLILRLYTSSDRCLHEWDERYHAVVAKNLIEHPFRPTLYDNPVLPYDYRNWAGNHIWLHKQPLPLWTMALSMRLFGVSEMALRLPSILLSTLGIWLAYCIGTFFFSKNTGYLAALFFSLNGLIIELTGGRVATDHIDIFLMFFILAGVGCTLLFVQRERTLFNLLAGACMGAAILSKWLPALIILPIWILIVLDSGKFRPKAIWYQFTLLVLTSVIVFLPWQIYIHRAFPLEASWEATYNLRHFTEVIEGQSGSPLYFLDRIRINYGELIYLPLIWFLWKTVTEPGNLKRLAVTVWFIVPLLIFSVAKTKMQGYLLFAAPALFIMTSEFYLWIADHQKQRKRKWFYSLVLILLIALPARYMIERVKPFGNTERHPQWVSDLKTLKEREIEQGVLFNFNKPVEAMFYTDLVAYDQIPAANVIAELSSKGYRILVHDNGQVPMEIRAMAQVTVVNIGNGQER